MGEKQSEKALEEIVQAIRFLPPMEATRILQQALEEQKQAARIYERSLLGTL